MLVSQTQTSLRGEQLNQCIWHSYKAAPVIKLIVSFRIDQRGSEVVRTLDFR